MSEHPFPEHLYVYRARAGRVVDGDTLGLVVVDLGYGLSYGPIEPSSRRRELKLRLLGINTPELKSRDAAERAAAVAAGDFVRLWLAKHWVHVPKAHWPLRIISHDLDDRDDFGRVLASVYCDGCQANLAQDLVTAGHARPAAG